MKIKIYAMFILSLLTINNLLNAQTNPRTLFKSFSITDCDNIYSTISKDMEIVEWDYPYVRFHITVNFENGNESMLKAAIMDGRYSVSSIQENNMIIFKNDQLNKKLIMNGVEIKEKVKIKVFVPKGKSLGEFSKAVIEENNLEETSL